MTNVSAILTGSPCDHGASRSRPTVCPVCHDVHTIRDAHAVGRFRPGGPLGFRAWSGGPLRATRAEAVADECRTRAERLGVEP